LESIAPPLFSHPWGQGQVAYEGISFSHGDCQSPQPGSTATAHQTGERPHRPASLPGRLPCPKGIGGSGDRPTHHPVHATVQRYNQQGPQALSDRRHTNPGCQPKLRPEETTQVLQALQSPPPDGGLWTGEKLRRWVVLAAFPQPDLPPLAHRRLPFEGAPAGRGPGGAGGL